MLANNGNTRWHSTLDMLKRFEEFIIIYLYIRE